ncbi:MAG: MerR family transcriptional regulator [Beijerinckiaceae bacterium]|nr:MAG: MerR family transcriptional regulator [Beijerinckiaceae bacterium]
MEKSAQAFRTISEVAQDLDLPQHVLRFWETRFAQIRPLKRGGGRRYYRPEDVDLLRAIRRLLYGEGYTIKGVQKILKEQGVRGVASTYGDAALPHAPLPADLMADEAADGEESDDLREPTVAASATTRGQDGYASASLPRAGLSAGDRDLLRELLTELVECNRILELAREA